MTLDDFELRIQGLPEVFKCPYYFRNGKSIRTPNLAGTFIYRVHPNKCPWKFLEKGEHWRIQGEPKVFNYPRLSQEWVKLRNSDLAGTFTWSIRTKAPI